ncbi:MAG: hypothetical protein AB7P52_04130 [Alphaproteobacteria bacterium]
MTVASRYFAAAPRRHGDRLARYGIPGSLMLWGLTLAFVPLYMLAALAAGATYFVSDGVRARFPALGLMRRRAERAWHDGFESLSSRLAHALGAFDHAGFSISRDRGDRVVISLPHSGAFEEGGATPSIGARHLLERLSSALRAGAWRIDVVGYDDGPSRDATLGHRAASAALGLAARRARAAVQALQAAGCRQPIAALGAPLSRLRRRRRPDAAVHAAPDGAEAIPVGIEIIVRRLHHGRQHAA